MTEPVIGLSAAFICAAILFAFRCPNAYRHLHWVFVALPVFIATLAIGVHIGSYGTYDRLLPLVDEADARELAELLKPQFDITHVLVIATTIVIFLVGLRAILTVFDEDDGIDGP